MPFGQRWSSSANPAAVDVFPIAEPEVFESHSGLIAQNKLLEKAGSNPDEADIRKLIDRDNEEQTRVKEEKGYFDSMLGKIKGDENNEPIVDAQKEKERLLKDSEEGKPLTGDETPIVKDKKSGVLKSIFQ